MDNQITKDSHINIKVGLDAQHNPVEIFWNATDSGFEEDKEVKAFILSLWDKKENNSLGLELWNKDMMVDEMKTFIYQSLISLSDLLTRSTGEKELSDDMKDFAAYFSKKAGLSR